jgi:hypothetical protein
VSGAGLRWVLLGGLFAAAFGIAFAMVRPVDSASIGPDAAAPVIHFERLLAGQRLDGHLTQTSKPLLTAIYGVLYVATGDWRPVAWAAITAFALCVVAGTILAGRAGGPVSAAFVAVGFLLSPALLLDVSQAYALSWAVLAWLVAGLAVTSSRPRYWLAGIALMLSVLARPESVAILVVAAGALIVAEIAARVRHRPRPPRAAYLVLLGVLSIPILMAHDQALTGDALHWAKAAELNSAHYRDLRDVLRTVLWIGHHFLDLAPLLPFALIGGVWLLIRRQWALAVGLAGVVLGISALFVWTGGRGVVLTTRYLAPIDVGLVLAAGIGLSALDVPALRRRLARFVRGSRRSLAAALAVGAIAGLSLAPSWPLNSAVRSAVAAEVRLHAHAHEAIDAIRQGLGARPSWRGAPASTSISSRPLVVVPAAIRAQAVVDLDLPLTEVAYSYGTWLKPVAGRPGPGAFIYHDALADKPSPRYTAVEIDHPTEIGGQRLVPVLVRAGDGLWVVRVEDAAP